MGKVIHLDYHERALLFINSTNILINLMGLVGTIASFNKGTLKEH
jgi:hypothetical protein